MNPALKLRGGPSGPTFETSTPGFVLTVQPIAQALHRHAALLARWSRMVTCS